MSDETKVTRYTADLIMHANDGLPGEFTVCIADDVAKLEADLARVTEENARLRKLLSDCRTVMRWARGELDMFTETDPRVADALMVEENRVHAVEQEASDE